MKTENLKKAEKRTHCKLFKSILVSSAQIYHDKIKANRLPPRFLRPGSMGAASGLICFTGGGSCSLSNFCSISALMLSPTEPSEDSWKLSTRAARLHLAATRRAAF